MRFASIRGISLFSWLRRHLITVFTDVQTEKAHWLQVLAGRQKPEHNYFITSLILGAFANTNSALANIALSITILTGCCREFDLFLLLDHHVTWTNFNSYMSRHMGCSVRERFRRFSWDWQTRHGLLFKVLAMNFSWVSSVIVCLSSVTLMKTSETQCNAL